MPQFDFTEGAFSHERQFDLIPVEHHFTPYFNKNGIPFLVCPFSMCGRRISDKPFKKSKPRRKAVSIGRRRF